MMLWLQDGTVSHEEFAQFMAKLSDKPMSKKKLAKLIGIVDPFGKGKISKSALMYWLLPEEHSIRAVAIGKALRESLNDDRI